MARNNLARNNLAQSSLAGAGLAGHLVACLPMAWPARAWARLVRERLRTRLSPASRSGLASAARPLVSCGHVRPAPGWRCAQLDLPHEHVTATTVLAR